MPRRPLNERSVATVLFTDIGGSTELASKVGDRRWREILKAHHGLVRRELKRFGGREVDTAGDGFFALFPQPARAVRCALAIVEGVERLGLTVRAGVHVGEVEPMGDNVGGIAVHIGARVAAKAQPGEIMVSSTLRDLMSGSDIGFSDRGVEMLKGVPGEWRLFSVDRAERIETAPLLPAEQSPLPHKKGLRFGVGIASLVAVVLGAYLLLHRTRTDDLPPRANSVGRLDARSGRWVSAVALGQNASPSGISLSDGKAWIISLNNKTLVRLDLETRAIDAFGVAGPPTGLEFAAGSLWLTTQYGQGSQEGSVLRYRLTSRGPYLEPPIPIGNGVRGIAFDGTALWVTNALKGTVRWFDPEAQVSSNDIPVGLSPDAIAFGGSSIWVASSLSKSVAKIDPKSHRVVATISVPDAPPSGIAVDASGLWIISKTANKVVQFSLDGDRILSLSVDAPRSIVLTEGGPWIGLTSSVVPIQGSGVGRAVPARGNIVAMVASGSTVWVAVGEGA